MNRPNREAAGPIRGSMRRYYVRVWSYEVPAYLKRGWRLACVRAGLPSERVFGPGYRDCLVWRPVWWLWLQCVLVALLARLGAQA